MRSIMNLDFVLFYTRVHDWFYNSQWINIYFSLIIFESGVLLSSYSSKTTGNDLTIFVLIDMHCDPGLN